jgi:tetratricopeptide (TPR) repeat protein
MPAIPASRSPHLLRADEEQLDRAAPALRSGTAFLVVVCPPALRAAALARLRSKVPGLAMPDPVEIGDAWKMLDALVEQAGRQDRVLSLTLGGDEGGALDALNLHREKALKGGPVILWLPDVDALVRMRERAPDAFSFRSTMVVVRGDGGPLPVPRGEESEEVARWRKQLKRARTPLERAVAGQALAEELRARGRNNEAAVVARKALDTVAEATNDEEHIARARLCRTLGVIARNKGSEAQKLFWYKCALTDVGSVSFTRGIDLEVLIKTTFPGPLRGLDRRRVNDAMKLVQDYGLSPELKSQALRSAWVVAAAIGDLRKARTLMAEYVSLSIFDRKIDQANAAKFMGVVYEDAGDFVAAESAYREAATRLFAEGSSLAAQSNMKDLALARGELGSAEVLASEANEGAEDLTKASRAKGDAGIAFAKGDLEVAVAGFCQSLHEAEAEHSDTYVLACCNSLVNVALAADDAERLSVAWTHMIMREIDCARDFLVFGPDGPPWYAIKYLNIRAQLLALTPDTLLQALVLSREAIDVARSAYADLLPESGFIQASLLLGSGNPHDALSVIANVEPYAAENGFLKERGYLLTDRVWALVQCGEPAASIAPHITALREALAATDSPRITAEILSYLARCLPPTSTTPDPYALAEEAATLFIAMPMPAEDARCLEIMGDVLLARGRSDEAKRRYQAAHARLSRYGLGLRIPLLEKKIAALP